MKSKLDPDLNHLLSRYGSSVISLDEITSLRSQRQLKDSFKISLADGEIVKARRFVSEDKRTRYCDLSSLLADLPVARILAAHGKATLEEWVDGVPLATGQVTTDQSYQLGTLLGKMHSTADIPECYRNDFPGADQQLARISESLSVLSSLLPGKRSLFNTLQELAARHQPERFETGLIHADFCPQNMVVKSGGVSPLLTKSSCELMNNFSIASWKRGSALRASNSSRSAPLICPFHSRR